MPTFSIPYGRTTLPVTVDDARLVGRFAPTALRAAADPAAEVASALDRPIGSEPLEKLAAGKRNAVIIASDHTRPVPSRWLIPPMLERLRRGRPGLDITLLVATGCHRAPTRDELVEKFGGEIVARERIVAHAAADAATQVELGTLPSGGSFAVNRLAAETDLLLSEGFIEPHFFAGFSGGRKSVLPGVAAHATVLANHCAEFIAHPRARAGVLDGNPIHRDMAYGARAAGLAFILNVVIDGGKNIVRAFAGGAEAAHRAGCDFLRSHAEVAVPEADIVVVGNGGHPLDQNVYQAVKGMTAAEAACRVGGVIIMVARCGDGHGGAAFYKLMSEAPSPEALSRRLEAVPRDATVADQWQAQILARILARRRVILVTKDYDHAAIRAMGMEAAGSPDEALGMAYRHVGAGARVAVMPDGVALVVKCV